MKAGRKLDALIAEKVMGNDRDWRKYLELRPLWVRGDKLTNDEYMAVALGGELPHYSTQIADAWLVAEKICGDEGHFELERLYWFNAKKTGWMAIFHKGDAEADTAPLAICLAALKSIGGNDD